jgi:RNA polymerase sigma factor (sigma-70 family)
MGLVHRVAHRFRWAIGASLDYEDLVQAGSMGLMKACDRFEPERGHKFSTYAEYWIWHHVARQALNHGRTVRVSVHTQIKLRTMGERLPTTFSLDAPIGDADGATHLDVLAAPALDPVAELEAEETRRTVARALERLPERARDVIEARFWDEMRLRDVGDPLGLSRERVRQIEAESLVRLRQLLGSERKGR